MIPYVVEFCTKFLWSDLCPKNVCRAFEFANLFEEPRLAERCLQVCCILTLLGCDPASNFRHFPVNVSDYLLQNNGNSVGC